MNPLYTQVEFEKAKSNDKLLCECYNCHNTFYLEKLKIQRALNPKQKSQAKFCSYNCHSEYTSQKEKLNCSHCNTEFLKKQKEIKKSKSGNHFCSKSCSTTYNNKNKTHGTRRSKLEVYIEEQLTLLYPSLEIHYNQKSTINSELDIYIPSLKLAFELNGIYHYEPIHGQDKLNQVQNNDQNKFQACIENNISLCIIDTSSFDYFKKEVADKFLKIILEIINSSLL